MKYWKAYAIALGFVLLVGAANTIPSQLFYRAPGVGAILRFISAKLSDTVGIKDYNPSCDGSGDDVTALTAAITSLPSTGGIVDASACAPMKIGSTLTMSKNGVTILLPSATISMGSNQIVVPVGVHNVALKGAAPYGGSVASQTAGDGTFLTYTGTGAAIQVGDSTGDTYGFTLQDVTLGLTTAGTAAIGVQLNRAINYTLLRPRVHGYQSANTQRAADLQGYTNFTGGKIEDPYFWNGNIGVYYGKNANANVTVGGVIVNNNSGGYCHYFAGDGAAVAAHGNAVFGGDCEPLTGTAFYFDYAATNKIFGVHVEAATTLINATANSSGNTAFLSNQTVNAVTDVGAGGISNSFVTTANTTLAAAAGTLWEFKNKTDAATVFSLYGGLTTGQNVTIGFRKWDNSLLWAIRKDTSENFQIINNLTSVNRIQFVASTGSDFINAESTGSVATNLSANSGTGGVIFGSGGASPSQVAQIASTGKFSRYNSIVSTANGVPSIHGVTINQTGRTTDLAASDVYNSAPAGAYRVCVNARTTVSGLGATTATLNIIWTDEGGAKTDVVGTWALNSLTVTGQINKCEFIHAAAATNIQISVTAGTYGGGPTAQYAIEAYTDRLN